MRKFLTKLAVFLLIGVALYVAAMAILGSMPLEHNKIVVRGNDGHLLSRYREAQTYGNVDVLFVGSSHCYRTFDTRYYAEKGLHTFNLGSSNQTPIQTLALLRLCLDSLNPRFVVFEVHPDVFSNQGVESSVDLLSNCPLTKSLTRMAFATPSLRTFNALTYAALDKFALHRYASASEDSIIRGNAYISGGFVERDADAFQPAKLAKRDIEICGKQTANLRECLAMLQRRGISCCLVEVPSSQALRNAYANHSTFEESMGANGLYFNCNAYPELTSRLVDSIHFADEDHLNQQGVAVFNEFFYNTILSPWMSQQK